MTTRKEENFFVNRLNDLPDSFVECRDIRHSWQITRRFHPVERKREKGSPQYVARTLTCSRCGCERTDVLSVRTFDRVSTSYAYPEGYQIVGNKVRNRGTLIRREAYKRAMEGAA